jgi:cytochrome c oxidase subunit 2
MISGTTGISGRIVENVFLYIGVICVFFLVLITFLTVFFVIRYRSSRHPQPVQIVGSLWLEIVWTVIPTFLVVTMFYYGYVGFQTLRSPPKNAMKVKVVARQWSWLFEYENGVKAPDLRVPVGKPVELLLTSQDVIHSFYLPAFKVKQDVVPGMETRLWFQPTSTGTYVVLCAEYCGLQHSYMLSKLAVLPEADFDLWLKGVQRERETEAAKGVSPGPRLFQEKGCKACHSIDGTPLVGPTLKGIFGKTVTVLTDGKERTVVTDEAYLRKSLVDPGSDVVKGFPPIMPSQRGILTDSEIEEMVKYLKELK